MNPDLLRDLAELDENYWWLRGKHELGYELMNRYRRPPAARILDVGGGGGQWAAFLRARGESQVILVDGSLAALQRARARGHRVVCARAEQLPFRSGMFDLVTAMDILEHVEQDEAMVKEVARVLQPQAEFLVHVPAHPFLYSYWDRLHGHFRRYTRGTLRRVLSNNGFRVERLGFAHMIAFLPAVLVRAAKSLAPRSDGQEQGSDFVNVGPFVNAVLVGTYHLEILLSRAGLVPCGLSLLALARSEDVR